MYLLSDPHIRVGGSEEGVILAKTIILEHLDTKTRRVTMKMDVSYTDHSHIIGKGGNTIRRVMSETGCHIHFPDSNRSNPNEKSNQVSIAGSNDVFSYIKPHNLLLFLAPALPLTTSYTLLFYNILTKKNKLFLILPSSLSRYSLAHKTRRIFQIL